MMIQWKDYGELLTCRSRDAVFYIGVYEFEVATERSIVFLLIFYSEIMDLIKNILHEEG